jgi:hypothetical protein
LSTRPNHEAICEHSVLRSATYDLELSERGPCHERKAHPAADVIDADLLKIPTPASPRRCTRANSAFWVGCGSPGPIRLDEPTSPTFRCAAAFSIWSQSWTGVTDKMDAAHREAVIDFVKITACFAKGTATCLKMSQSGPWGERPALLLKALAQCGAHASRGCVRLAGCDHDVIKAATTGDTGIAFAPAKGCGHLPSGVSGRSRGNQPRGQRLRHCPLMPRP